MQRKDSVSTKDHMSKVLGYRQGSDRGSNRMLDRWFEIRKPSTMLNDGIYGAACYSQKEKEAKRKKLWIMMENLSLRFRFTTLPTVRPTTTPFYSFFLKHDISILVGL